MARVVASRWVWCGDPKWSESNESEKSTEPFRFRKGLLLSGGEWVGLVLPLPLPAALLLLGLWLVEEEAAEAASSCDRFRKADVLLCTVGVGAAALMAAAGLEEGVERAPLGLVEAVLATLLPTADPPMLPKDPAAPKSSEESRRRRAGRAAEELVTLEVISVCVGV